MTLLMTLLTLFLGGRPTAAVPPEPAPTHVSVGWNLSFETTPPEDPFGLPLVTSTARHSSPSLMVAAPPEGYSAPFDVFSPAVRPPHEFPTLYPCDAVTLVPCPPPLPAYEAPAVRHVSFTGEGQAFQIAQAQAECEAGTCPLALDHHAVRPGMVLTHRVFGHALPALGLWEQLHARQHAPEHPHHTALACEAGQACPLTGVPMVCPLGFGGPLNAPAFVVAAQNENHPGCPVALPGHPFPGAKSVQHVVSATYDVPSSSAKALVQILEKSNGVFGCKVEGDELTVNATPPAQMAIATFLCTIVNEEQTVSQPAKTISIHHTETKPCPTECTEAKACTTECSATKACTTQCSEVKCCSECGEKCACCKCGKTKPATGEPTAATTSKLHEIRFSVGLRDCKACPPEDCDWVAIVNDAPILASEVLEPFNVQLAQAKRTLAAERYEEARRMLIQRNLEKHIERKLMAEGLEAVLSREDIQKVHTLIDQNFAKETARLMKDFGVKTREELQQELQKQHTSLAALKTNFASQRLAMEWLCRQREPCKCDCAEAQCAQTKPQTIEPTAYKTLDEHLFNVYVGLTDCKPCPPTTTKPVAIHVEATQVKPVIVKIQATPDGVLLQTSDGTHVRAQSIQLETHGVNRLLVEHGQIVHTPLKPAPQPATAPKQPEPVSTY